MYQKLQSSVLYLYSFFGLLRSDKYINVSSYNKYTNLKYIKFRINCFSKVEAMEMIDGGQ